MLKGICMRHYIVGNNAKSSMSTNLNIIRIHKKGEISEEIFQRTYAANIGINIFCILQGIIPICST